MEFALNIPHSTQYAHIVGYMAYDRNVHDCPACRESYRFGQDYGERVRANVARNEEELVSSTP
jgi:hypothetical protein